MKEPIERAFQIVERIESDPRWASPFDGKTSQDRADQRVAMAELLAGFIEEDREDVRDDQDYPDSRP